MKSLLKQKKYLFFSLLIIVSIFFIIKHSIADDSLGAKLSGRILLQVEDRGQAWYVNPENEKKYYLGTPEESFLLSRQLGFYMDKNILNNYLNNSFPDNYSGRVIINAQETYEAYYINPLDLKALPLNSPLDAFNIMKNLSLGITNENLKLIETYNYLNNELFSNEIIGSSFGVEVSVFEPNKMKDFTRIIELSAKISNPQNRRILERGLVWDYVTIPDVSVDPTLKNNYQRVLSENNSEVFTVKISDLVPGSYPFFRAYVITEDNETIYSNIQTIQGEKSLSLPLVPAPSHGTSGSNSSIIIIPKFILNYGAGDGGDIEGPSLQMVDKGSEGELVIAKAAPGYKFVSWSDGFTDPFRVDVPVDSNVVVIAQFVPICAQSEFVYDDFLYHTVAIGDQCWIKENLRNSRTASGNLILSFCYNDDDRNCNVYGRLYPLAALSLPVYGSDDNPSGVQGICPNDWHLPSKLEWEQLVSWISTDGGIVSGLEGKSLKADSSRWSPNTGADNFGFTALPGGYHSSIGYVEAGSSARFWTTTKGSISYSKAIEGTYFAFNLYSVSDDILFEESEIDPVDYLSVRCVQD